MCKKEMEAIFSKIEPDEELKTKIIQRIEQQPQKTKRMHFRKPTMVLAASLAAVICVTTAFAAAPAIQETIGDIISYFQSKEAVELSSAAELAKFSEKIGKSVTKNGYTLTLNNVAADDNYIHIFYTLKSEEPFFQNNIRLENNIFLDCIVDGKLAGYTSNHNQEEGYFSDKYMYTGVMKYSLAEEDIPNNFQIELFGYTDKNDLSQITASNAVLSDKQKEELLYLSTNVDKSAATVQSVSKKINTPIPWLHATAEKVVLSPFGNQLVLSIESNHVADSDFFALFDENGKSLDILNTTLRETDDSFSKNSFEFLKADKHTKSLQFVPVILQSHGDIEPVYKPIGTYPIEYRTSDYGKIVVTDIRISDGKIEIDYYKDGFVFLDPAFHLADEHGNNAEPGGKLGCTLYTRVHHDTNSYTAVYQYEEYDYLGNRRPIHEGVRAEALSNNFKQLGLYEHSYRLDFDKAVTVHLK